MKLLRKGGTLIKESGLLCEDEGSSHWHHEVFISTLHDNGALALPHAFLDGIRYLTAPYSICIVQQMINPVLLSHYAEFLHPIRHPWSEATSCRCYCQYIFRSYLFNSRLKSFQIRSKEISLLLQLDTDRD